MTHFYLAREGETSGPLAAEELRARAVRPDDLVRRGEDGPFRPFSELVSSDRAARAALEDALEPDEPAPEPWQTRPVIGYSWVAMLLAADGFFIAQTAAAGSSFAGRANAALLLATMGASVYGLLARRPWAWPLTALLTGAVAAWLLAPLLTSFGAGLGLWFGLNLLATAFLVWSRPRGQALDWPPRARRLILVFSTDPEAEVRRGPGRSAGPGPAAAAIATAAFFALVLGGVFVYHRLRFPGIDLPIGLVPRGGDLVARLAATSVYLLMVGLALALASRGRAPLTALGIGVRQGLGRTLWTGTRIFLVLFLVLLAGRWVLRSVEAVEQRLQAALGQADPEEPAGTTQVREAVREVVERPTRRPGVVPWSLAVALLIGPLCEEIFFRGLLFGALRRRLRFLPAALASAAVFAAAHWLGAGWGAAAPVLALEVVAGGVAAAYAYELSRSLLAPICLHVLWNAATTATGLLPGG